MKDGLERRIHNKKQAATAASRLPVESDDGHCLRLATIIVFIDLLSQLGVCVGRSWRLLYLYDWTRCAPSSLAGQQTRRRVPPGTIAHNLIHLHEVSINVRRLCARLAMDSTYAPQSPDLSGLRPQSPDLAALASPLFPNHPPHLYPHHPQGGGGGAGGGNRFGRSFTSNGYPAGALNYPPTSFPPQHQQHLPARLPHQHQLKYAPPTMPPTTRGLRPDYSDEYMPDAPPSKRARRDPAAPNSSNHQHAQQPQSDPTLGVHLKTSFPVARIKRIMQADEDVGKVAQVTPHVVSRALELFMIRLVSASAEQAQGSGAGGNKGPRRILAQHMKRAVMADNTFDFLHPIVEKVLDAPAKGKKESNSDEEEEKPKKGRGRKRKDSGDDF